MDNFTYYNPVRIISGGGTVSQTGGAASVYGKKALFVYGRGSLKRNGVYAAITQSLRAAGVAFIEHKGVKPNPVITHVRAGIRKARLGKCTVVVAAGGGSVLDEAKAIAAGVKYGGDAWDLFSGKAEPAQSLPVIAIPTLPASGSEMNSGFVITNPAARQKLAAHSDACFPKTAILDPGTTAQLPALQSAYGAVDALSHLLEGYFTAATPDARVTDELVEGLARSIISSTRRILRDPSDHNARAAMMWAAALAANGLCLCGYKEPQFLYHAIEHSLSALCDVPHGAGLAIIMPGCFRQQLGQLGPARLAAFGRKVLGTGGTTDKQAALLAIKGFEKLFAGFGAPSRLRQAGVSVKEIPAIARHAGAAASAQGIACTPSEIEKILRSAA
ncbi:MAG TPA: iron-containing alcohol dehydrogenase [Elusimicrobiales bacterium]|nr:iron-containing alcohol dehydrogenase [Elusimicrobiales bacterium]